MKSNHHDIFNPIRRWALAIGFLFCIAPLYGASEPDTLDPWKLHRTRCEAIHTVTFYTTDVVHLLREPLDPIEDARAVIVEGKVDRLRRESKVNLFLDFGTMQFGSQYKKSPETTHTLQRSIMVVHGSWVPLDQDTVTTTTENPERLIFDMLFLPDPVIEWIPVGEPEVVDYTVDGILRRASFRSYRNETGLIEVSMSIDGRAVRSVKAFSPSGVLMTDGRVTEFRDFGPFGLIPRHVYFHQSDRSGTPFREMTGSIEVFINEPDFNYLFK